MKIIEVKPRGRGWEVFEIAGVESLFIGRDGRRLAITYARTRQELSQADIRVLNSAGEIVETIYFDSERDCNRPVRTLGDCLKERY